MLSCGGLEGASGARERAPLLPIPPGAPADPVPSFFALALPRARVDILRLLGAQCVLDGILRLAHKTGQEINNLFTSSRA